MMYFYQDWKVKTDQMAYIYFQQTGEEGGSIFNFQRWNSTLFMKIFFSYVF